MAEMMRQVWISRYGPPEVLELREAAMPRPADDQILIKVAASGVNFADIMARLHLYPDAPKPPCVVGYEIAGEVVAAGPAARAFSPGDRVVAFTRFGEEHVLDRYLLADGWHPNRDGYSVIAANVFDAITKRDLLALARVNR